MPVGGLGDITSPGRCRWRRQQCSSEQSPVDCERSVWCIATATPWCWCWCYWKTVHVIASPAHLVMLIRLCLQCVCVCMCVHTMHPTGKTESGRVMSQFSKVAKLMIIKEKVTQKRLEDEAAAGTAMPLKSFLDTSRAFVNANFENPASVLS